MAYSPWYSQVLAVYVGGSYREEAFARLVAEAPMNQETLANALLSSEAERREKVALMMSVTDFPMTSELDDAVQAALKDERINVRVSAAVALALRNAVHAKQAITAARDASVDDSERREMQACLDGLDADPAPSTERIPLGADRRSHASP